MELSEDLKPVVWTGGCGEWTANTNKLRSTRDQKCYGNERRRAERMYMYESAAGVWIAWQKKRNHCGEADMTDDRATGKVYGEEGNIGRRYITAAISRLRGTQGKRCGGQRRRGVVCAIRLSQLVRGGN